MVGFRTCTTVVMYLAVLALWGCRDLERPDSPAAHPSGPAGLEASRSDGPRGFYPLDVGDRWLYRRSFDVVVTLLDDVPDTTSEHFEGTSERIMTGTEVINDREYVVQKHWFVADDLPADTTVRWTRFRQDHAGLYTAGTAANVAPGMERAERSHAGTGGRHAMIPSWKRLDAATDGILPSGARAAWKEHVRRLADIQSTANPGPALDLRPAGRPGGDAPGEIIRLKYPLHPGAEWVNRRPVRVRYEVEGLEVLPLGTGRVPTYRILRNDNRLDENDHVTLWIGRCGRVRYHAHLETTAFDLDTGYYLHIVTDDIEWLVDVDLTGPGRFQNRTME